LGFLVWKQTVWQPCSSLRHILTINWKKCKSWKADRRTFFSVRYYLGTASTKHPNTRKHRKAVVWSCRILTRIYSNLPKVILAWLPWPTILLTFHKITKYNEYNTFNFWVHAQTLCYIHLIHLTYVYMLKLYVTYI
jgi:hypothetical protein